MIENILGVGLDIPLLGKNTNFYCYKNKLQFTNKGFLLKDGITKNKGSLVWYRMQRTSNQT